MKAKLLFGLLIANTLQAFCQNPIVGSWKIDNLIGYERYQNASSFQNIYALKKQEGKEYVYGNSVTFSPEGTFSCGYSAPCGNDCFSSVSGYYKMVDEHHVRIQLDTIWASNDCQVTGVAIDKQSRLYYLVNGENSIRLIESDGLIANDLLRIEYSKIILDFENDGANWPNLGNLQWHVLKDNYSNNDEVLKMALATIKGNTPENQKILFSKSIRNNYSKAFLFEYDGKRGLLVLERQNAAIVDLK